jgi:hypothetical protein
MRPLLIEIQSICLLCCLGVSLEGEHEKLIKKVIRLFGSILFFLRSDSFLFLSFFGFLFLNIFQSLFLIPSQLIFDPVNKGVIDKPELIDQC